MEILKMILFISVVVMTICVYTYMLYVCVSLYRGKGNELYIAISYLIICTGTMMEFGIFGSSALTFNLLVVYIVALYRHTDLANPIKKHLKDKKWKT